MTLAGPIAERSKSSDLDRGRGDPGSNLGEGMNKKCFRVGDGKRNVHHIVCVHSWLKTMDQAYTLEFPDTISGASEAQAFKWKSSSHLDFELVTQRRSGSPNHSGQVITREQRSQKKMQQSTIFRGSGVDGVLDNLSDVANLLHR